MPELITLRRIFSTLHVLDSHLIIGQAFFAQLAFILLLVPLAITVVLVSIEISVKASDGPGEK